MTFKTDETGYISGVHGRRRSTEWQPIETAPGAKLVLLWQRAWRHPYIGMVTDPEVGTVFLESPDYGKGDLTAFAELWMPLPEPPK